jgi:hypothetical protein
MSVKKKLYSLLSFLIIISIFVSLGYYEWWRYTAYLEDTNSNMSFLKWLLIFGR